MEREDGTEAKGQSEPLSKCVRCAAGGPAAGRHAAVLNEAAAQTISSSRSVIGHGEVRASLTT